MGLELKIVSPAKVEYQGMVEKVIVPGISGQFEILSYIKTPMASMY